MGFKVWFWRGGGGGASSSDGKATIQRCQEMTRKLVENKICHQKGADLGKLGPERGMGQGSLLVLLLL